MTPTIALLIFLIIVIICWLALTRNAKEYKPDFEVHPLDEAHVTKKITSEVVVEEPAGIPEPVVSKAEPVSEALTPDDLTLLEGIGPKVSQVLNAAGINTFSDLAKADMPHLKEILLTAGYGYMDPSSWSEQADLAAQGKFQELNELTSKLKGGKKVG